MPVNVMNKLAIFDWNGTLIDDSRCNWEAANHCIALFGIAPLTYDQYRDTMDFPVLHFYTRNGIDSDTYLKNFQQAGAAFLDNYKRLAAAAPLRRGATALFDTLLDHGYDLVILSNFVQHELEAQVASYHIGHYFKHICGNYAFNEVEHSRTNKRERLDKLMTENGYSADNAFIIGDSLEEPEIARALGITSFSVTWGCISPARIEAAGTHHLIDELDEIPALLSLRSAA